MSKCIPSNGRNWRDGGHGSITRRAEDLTARERAERETAHHEHLQVLARNQAQQKQRTREFEETKRLARLKQEERDNCPGFVFAKSCRIPKDVLHGDYSSRYAPVELLQDFGDWAVLGTGVRIGNTAIPLKLISSPSTPIELTRRLGGRLSLGLIAGAATSGVLAGTAVGTIALLMPNSTSDDSAFYKREQYDKLDLGYTQVRVHIKQLPNGAVDAYGFYSGDNPAWRKVPIIKATARDESFVADLGQGIELIWTPLVDTSKVLGIPKLEGAPPPQLVMVYPTTERASRIVVDPVYPPDYQDAILVFPVETGLLPIYVALGLSGDHRYHRPPEDLLAFPDAKRAKAKSFVQGGGKKRRRWTDSSGKIYEWDFQHGKVEIYGKRGNHLGEFDPNTGEQTKPADPARKIEK